MRVFYNLVTFQLLQQCTTLRKEYDVKEMRVQSGVEIQRDQFVFLSGDVLGTDLRGQKRAAESASRRKVLNTSREGEGVRGGRAEVHCGGLDFSKVSGRAASSRNRDEQVCDGTRRVAVTRV